MKTIKVQCQGCGSFLEVNDSTRYVTCNACTASLEVVHQDTVTHTCLSPDTEPHVLRLIDEVKLLRLQNELGRINEDWECYRRAMLIAGKTRRGRPPTIGGAILGGLLIGLVSAIIIGQASMPATISGLLFMAVGIYVGVSGTGQAKRYLKRQQDYEASRAVVRAGIDEEKRRLTEGVTA